jgi:hypothetical protein
MQILLRLDLGEGFFNSLGGLHGRIPENKSIQGINITDTGLN